MRSFPALVLMALAAASAAAHTYPDTVWVKVGGQVDFSVIDQATCAADVYYENLQDPTLAAITPDQGFGIEVVFTVTANDTPGVTELTIHWVGEDVGEDGGACTEDTREFGGVQVVLRVTPDKVNAATDGGDSRPGDGHCDSGENVAVGGAEQPECSLRAAIEEANAGGATLIEFADHLTTIQPDRPLPPITRAVTVEGPGGSGRLPPNARPDPRVVLVGRATSTIVHGLTVESGGAGTQIKVLGVRGFSGNGVFVRADRVVVEGCHLWENGIHGVSVTDAKDVEVGGPGAGVGNVIYANGESGVYVLRGEDVVVVGNWIGLSPSGSPSGNGGSGVAILVGTDVEVGGPTPTAGEPPGNWIAASERDGVSVSSSEGVVVAGNRIGLIGGVEEPLVDHGNRGAGVRVSESMRTTVGGTRENARNSISGNNAGVVVTEDVSEVAIRRNEIYRNAGLAIDLGDDGPTANDFGATLAADDPDSGPNGLLNFPAGVTASADRNALDKWVLTGRLETPSPETATVEIYASERPAYREGAGPATRFGDLQHFVAEATPTRESGPTRGGYFRVVVPRADVPYPILSATATDAGGRTSEVSWVCLDLDNNGTTDNDGDGLCDDWETRGIDYDGDNTVDLDLTPAGRPVSDHADPLRQDLFVEVDWMAGSQPQAEAFPPVVAAFATSPRRIRLHVELSEQTRAFDPIAFGTLSNRATPGGSLADIKDGSPVNPCGGGAAGGHFGSPTDRAAANCRARLGARGLVYRYALFGRNHAPRPGSSGVAELPGNDFLVTVSSWGSAPYRMAGLPAGAPAATARAVVQSTTFMHEMGHTLRLGHGGGDVLNCKPNHPSIMSYTLQFPVYLPSRVMDYSRERMPTLVEGALVEAQGLRGPADRQAVYRSGTDLVITSTGQRTIDWDLDGTIQASPLLQEITNLKPSCGNPGISTLVGAADWDILEIDFRGSMDYQSSGATSPVSLRRRDDPETLTDQDLIEIAETVDYDGDGFSNAADNCPAIANPDQTDADDDGIGDACQGPLADVAVLQGVEEGAGGPTFYLQVMNFGPEPATDVVVTDTLVAGLTATSIDAPGGTCATGGQVVRCTYATVAAGDTLAVTVRTTGEAAGTTTASAAYAFDPNPTNNRADAVTGGSTNQAPEDPADAVPTELRLHPASPNPTAGRATLAFDLPGGADVRVEVFDTWGRQVATLAEGPWPPGRHTVVFDGAELASGVYVVRLRADRSERAVRVVLTR